MMGAPPIGRSEFARYQDPGYNYQSPFYSPSRESMYQSPGGQVNLDRSAKFGQDNYQTLLTLFGGGGPFAKSQVERGMQNYEREQQIRRGEAERRDAVQRRIEEESQRRASAPRLSPAEQYRIRLALMLRGLGGISNLAVGEQERMARMSGAAPWRPSYY